MAVDSVVVKVVQATGNSLPFKNTLEVLALQGVFI